MQTYRKGGIGRLILLLAAAWLAWGTTMNTPAQAATGKEKAASARTMSTGSMRPCADHEWKTCLRSSR